MKTLTPYILGMYLGQKIKYSPFRPDAGIVDGIVTAAVISGIDYDGQLATPTCYNVKLMLRPLSSMIKEEAKEYLTLFQDMPDNFEIVDWMNSGTYMTALFRWIDKDSEMNNDDGYSYCEIGIGIDGKSKRTAAEFQWLLSKGFDLFGIIDAELAINNIKS